MKIVLITEKLNMGIGDWGLGIGDWAQSPIPNPQSPCNCLIEVKKVSFIFHKVKKYINKSMTSRKYSTRVKSTSFSRTLDCGIKDEDKIIEEAITTPFEKVLKILS